MRDDDKCTVYMPSFDAIGGTTGGKMGSPGRWEGWHSVCAVGGGEKVDSIASISDTQAVLVNIQIHNEHAFYMFFFLVIHLDLKTLSGPVGPTCYVQPF